MNKIVRIRNSQPRARAASPTPRAARAKPAQASGGMASPSTGQAMSKRGFRNTKYTADAGSRAEWSAAPGQAPRSVIHDEPFVPTQIGAPATALAAVAAPSVELFPAKPELQPCGANADMLQVQVSPPAETTAQATAAGAASETTTETSASGGAGPQLRSAAPSVEPLSSSELRALVCGAAAASLPEPVVPPLVVSAFEAEIAQLAHALALGEYYSYVVRRAREVGADKDKEGGKDGAALGDGSGRAMTLMEIYEQQVAEEERVKREAKQSKKADGSAAAAEVPTKYGKFGRTLPSNFLSFDRDELFKADSSFGEGKSKHDALSQLGDLSSRFGPGA